MLRRIADYIHSHGAAYTLRRACEKAAERLLHHEHRLLLAMQPTDEALQRQRNNQPGDMLISVVTPVYNTQADMLLAMAASLHAQTYQAWEAVLYDGASTRPETLDALKKAAQLDSRIRVIYGTENQGISGNTNAAIAQARGEYLALCDHDDLLTPDALWRVAEAIRDTGAEMLYSDEDKVTEDGRWHTDPHLKPDFGPDTLRSGNYICHLMVLKADLVRRAGGLRPAFDGSQDHDLALRCSELANRVAHIPHVLYHWRSVGASMSHQRLQACMDAACRAVQEQMTRIGYPGTARMVNGVIRLQYDIPASVSIRVLMLSSGRHPAKPVPSCLLRNGVAVQRITDNEIDAAALAAAEDYLLFLDEDAVPLGDDFLNELLMYAQRNDVGAVCPVVLTARWPRTILAAGLTVMQDGAIRPRHAGQPYAGGGLRAQALTSHNVCAVPPVCFMLRRDHFVPFGQALDHACIVRWCARLSQQGLYHVYTPHAAMQLGRYDPPQQRMPAGFRDPYIHPLYTYGQKADLKLRKGALHHAAD